MSLLEIYFELLSEIGLPVSASLEYTVTAFISLPTPFTLPITVLHENKNKHSNKVIVFNIYIPGIILLTSSTTPLAVPAIVLHPCKVKPKKIKINTVKIIFI